MDGANRSAIGISAVGTSIRITEKALAPDDSVRVLTAIDARSASVGLPILMWYFEAASAAAVMNAVLSVPPRRAAASFVSRNGARVTSICRRSDRAVHNGERALSVSESCDTMPAQRVGGRVARRRQAGGVGEQLEHLPNDADGQPEAAGDERQDAVDSGRFGGFVGVVFGWRQRRWVGRVAFEVEVLQARVGRPARRR